MKAIVAKAALDAGCADPDALERALKDAACQNTSLVEEILDHELVEESAFLRALSQELGLKWHETVTPDSVDSPDLKSTCKPQLGVRYRILPLRFLNGDTAPSRIELVTWDPFDLAQRQAARREITCPIRWSMAPRRHVIEALQSFYGVGADTFEEILEGREVDTDHLELQEEANVLDLDDEEASVKKFVNQIIREALAQRATDIHVEPLENDLRIRYRIDGVLRGIPVPENIKSLQASVISTLKVMARLDIAERRLPQDGRISLQLDGHPMDVRVATIPGVEGESVSLRLLGQERFTLDRLQLLTDMREKVESLIQHPNGIVLVTGPTGSGKSTTLYSFLSELNSESRRIVTIEDPVENKLEGVIQIAVKPEIDLTFATGLRSILRGDPNVIMVGEIRDLETAEIAIRSALTGHLVFSTLHTNDAIGGITRLIDMGVEPFLVSASVRAFIAQRLVRKLCERCRKPGEYPASLLDQYGFPREGRKRIMVPNPAGCEKCRGTGFLGRLAIYELCEVRDDLRDVIAQRGDGRTLLQTAEKEGFLPMRDYGWRKVVEGLTSVDEVLTATRSS